MVDYTNYTSCLHSHRHMSLEMDRISNLRTGCLGKMIQVRVLQKWKPNFRKNETWFIIIDKNVSNTESQYILLHYITLKNKSNNLVHTLGDAIQVLGQRADQSYVESSLFVSQCYQISDYTCTNVDPYQKFISNPFQINVGVASTIEEIPYDGSIPKTNFHFCSRSHLNVIADKNIKYPGIKSYIIYSYKEL